MKRIIILAIALCIGLLANAQAQELSDTQMQAIFAGEDATITDDIIAVASAVANQKNIAVIGSLELGAVSNSVIDNINTALVTNTGDSAIALQTNIGAICSMSEVDSEGNVITNTNDAQVDNIVMTDAGSLDAVSSGTTSNGAGTNSVLTTISALQSAVAAQNNIGAICSMASTTGATVANSNNAVVSNMPQ